MPFRDVIGHRKLVTLLSRSIARDALPPSLIFAGPIGVGKRLVADAVAQAVNCLAPRLPSSSTTPDALEHDACGECTACLRIARGVHPDVVIVAPGDSGSIKIEPIRDLVDRVGYRPFEGRRRVVIIDEADALVTAAQNALLKTLEEPPSASMFLLVTAHPDTLLATVRSRCPRLRFQPLGPGEVAAALEKQGMSEHEARTIAATSDGSIGHALDASGQDLANVREVAARVLAQVAQGDDPGRRIDSAKDLLAKTGAGGASDREMLATHLRVMSSLLRDVELMAMGADRASLANGDITPALDRLAAFRGDRGIRAFGAVDRALAALERNASVKIVADWLTLNL
jgi:DNA polymerase-3 subunit delta'